MIKQHIIKILLNLLSIGILPVKFRTKLLNLYKNINAKEIRDKCYFNSPNVKIGKGTFINRECKFYSSYCDDSKILIEENCYLGMNVSMITISHEIGNSKQRAGKNTYKGITIGNGCWIGANVTILGGVKIGDGCVIGAGSVVTKDCKPNTLYAGVPAKEIRTLD